MKGQLETTLLVLVTLGLVAFGLVMVYSATSAPAALGGGDPGYYLKRQSIYALVGLGLMLAATRLDFRRLREASRRSSRLVAVLCCRRARPRRPGERREAVAHVRSRRLPALGARQAGALRLGRGVPDPPPRPADDA